MAVLRLQLTNAGSVEPGVIRIPHPGYTLQVQLSVGTRFHAGDTVLRTNHPISSSPDESLIKAQNLLPAYYVDKTISILSDAIADGKVSNLPPQLEVHHVDALRQYLLDGLHRSDLPRYLTIDVEAAVEQLRAHSGDLPKQFEMLRMRAVNYGAPQRQNILRTRGIVDDKKFQIGSIHLDVNYACALYKPPGHFSEERIDEFRMALNTLNTPYWQHYDSIVREAVTNILNTFQYNRYDPNGPRLGPVTRECPLVWRYFSEITTNEVGSDGAPVVLPLANNGWIFGSDPTDDFIAPGKECYIRRQVVIWGDNVKLNFGQKPADSPALWDYMRQYVQSVAQVCHAIRLDNAHSTPISVGEYFIREARKINPALYVMAELFTSSEEKDIEYINRLGINSLMGEGKKRIEPPKMSHLLWSSGGRPVAALDIIDSNAAIQPVRQIPGVIFDLTHDNEPVDFEPLTTIVAIGMSCSPVGTTRGCDDLLPFNPSVVTEFRPYPLSIDSPALQPARKLVNELRVEMAGSGMEELMSNYYGNLLTIFRYNSQTGEGVWAIVRGSGDTTVDQIEIPAPISALAFEGRINSIQRFNDDGDSDIKPSKVDLFLNTNLKKLQSVELVRNHAKLHNFPVGTVAVFKTSLPSELQEFLSTLEIDRLASQFKERIKSLKLTFAAKSAGMGSSVFRNIREGNWLITAMSDRLFQSPGLIPLEGFFRRTCESTGTLPRFLIPKYLDRIVRAVNIAARSAIFDRMSPFVQQGDDLVQSLSATSVSFYTPVRNAQLVHPQLTRQFASLLTRGDTSTAAGFPHFSTGFMRSWGRDTFIALRGLFLVTGRFAEARDQLIAFAACLRHGLIPNLHDGGLNPRYNSRDATWWFLQALQDYALMSGEDVFSLRVPRLFPSDDQGEHYRQWHDKPRPVVTLGDIVQEIMTRHANGIHFQEWNSGSKLDSVMRAEGFQVDIVTDWTNGFILGGNEHNCGTWMDKMGASERARNLGTPATSRDGAAVEIIGLLESTLRWLSSAHEDGSFAHAGVTVRDRTVTWAHWSSLICAYFESWFYVPLRREHDAMFFIEERHVGVRGIYKDTVGSSSEFADYQFRPNAAVAMTVAPELFDPVHAVLCLNLIGERLMGHVGMRTLDPGDYRYRPTYRSGDDTEDFLTSKGFNYHNGPEWVWPVGYFFRASMRFRRGITDGMRQMLAHIKKEHFGSWASGLPELTGRDGEPCGDGCQNQAWSVSAILDILYDYSLLTPEDIVNWDAEGALDDLEL
jgi:glycogen debranching enzyme